jgi:ATP-dependent Clp protease adaptor protein ClpS
MTITFFSSGKEAGLMSGRIPDSREDTFSETDEEISEPPMYRVLIHNDDFTTKAFVVEILTSVFNKSIDEATRIMWQAHRNGTGLCGIYTLEVAETKVNLVTAAARENGFPLKLTLEED